MVSLDRPRILLMGPRRSGKSSIQRVVFQKMSPHETLFLERSVNLSINFIANNPYVQFEVWDFAGDVSLADGVLFEDQMLSADLIFGNCAAIVYVIDAQDDPAADALGKLHDVVTLSRSINPSVHFEIFIHKVDGEIYLSEDHKLDLQRDIQEQVELELEEAADTEITLSFYLTSIYDHSVFEAFSKVVHKLIPQLPAMENLLNILIANCEVEKVFLYDVVSKLYIATDHNPVDIQSYEMCSDMIEVAIDVSCIYGMQEGDTVSSLENNSPDLGISPASSSRKDNDGSLEADQGSSINSYEDDGGGESDNKRRSNERREDFYNDKRSVGSPIVKKNGISETDRKKLGAEPSHDNHQKREGMAFDCGSSSLIKLNNNMTLYLQQVANHLALVCMLRTPNCEKQGLIEYNVECFRKSLAELFHKVDDV